MKTNLSFVILLACAASASAFTIDTVPVGNIGNTADPAEGSRDIPGLHFGAVGYAYNIGKYEVTVSQYTEFLNAVAAIDTYGLYDTRLATSLSIAGIARSGASGSYHYSVIGSPNHPVTYVDFGNASRFVNWLQNGQPTGSQNARTTEDGAYTLNGKVTASGLRTVVRNPDAKWFIPTTDEWYKAAYHQPASQGGDSDDYWEYPMMTNSEPYSDEPPGATPDNSRVANIEKNDQVANGYDDGYALPSCRAAFHDCLTDVGSYTSSPSYYGTFDQGGNVWEWNETQVGPYRAGAAVHGSAATTGLTRRAMTGALTRLGINL